MNGLWESIKLFLASHRIATMIVTGAMGASVVGAGGYVLYNDMEMPAQEPEQEVVQEVEVEEDNAAEDVYIPEFKNVVITTESLEKDLTIYFADEEDNPITGVPFEIKLLTPKAAEGLQSYITAIDDLDKQIAEYTDDSANASGVLRDRNASVTVTDENGDVVDKQRGDISSDPLYQLYLDKEAAVQSYAKALSEAEGKVYTDDDEDGVIVEKDVEPGDYTLCLVNSEDNPINYEPTSYATKANVKDKVEFKVQKEITKQIKKDVASEDGQKKTEAVPVESKPKDTQEYVDSRKEENGGSIKETTDVVAPKNTAKVTAGGKATRKEGGKTSVTHEVAGTTFTITIKCVDENGKEIKKTTETKKAGENYSYSAPAIDKYAPLPESTTQTDKVEKNIEIVFKYQDLEAKKAAEEAQKRADEEAKKKADEEAKKKADEEAKKKADEEAKRKADEEAKQKAEEEAKKKAEEEAKKAEEEKNKNQSGEGGDASQVGEGGQPQTTTPADGQPTASRKIKTNGAVAIAFNTRGAALGARLIQTATNTTTETATLDMSYSGGTFTIKASGNVSGVKVNGAEVAMKDGQGTYKVTADGDYKLTGVATFSDKHTDDSLNVTYTVSGFSAASSEKLKDSKGNQLYLDPEAKTEATAANYEKGKTYYYKDATYKYYGWQSINGITYYYDKNGNVVTGTQVIQGVQYNFGSDGALMVNGTGIDVSKYQGKIDWNQAKSSVSFAIIRCGYRGMYDGQLHEDPYFYKNMSGAKAAGVQTGVYLYSTALNEAEAVQEASMAVAMAGKAGGCSYPIYIDMEDTVRGQSKLSTEQRCAIVNAFVSTVQSSGYKGGVYCSKNWMTNRMNAGAISGSASIWIAQYNTSCTYSGRKNMWQYSSKGSVPGIKGYVDMNKAF